MRWSGGWRRCVRGWRRATSGWTRFWREWKKSRRGRKGGRHEQTYVEDGRRYACDCDAAFCGVAGGGVSRASRSEDCAEMVVGTRWVDDAGVRPGCAVGWKISV